MTRPLNFSSQVSDSIFELSQTGLANLVQTVVIQGIADVNMYIPRDVISRTIEFCADAFDTERDVQQPVASNSRYLPLNTGLSPMEQAILKGIAERKVMRAEDTMHVGAFATERDKWHADGNEERHVGIDEGGNDSIASVFVYYL